MENQQTEGAWMDVLDERQKQHIRFCRAYALNYGHGAPGHLDMILIAALSRLLDEREPHEQGEATE